MNNFFIFLLIIGLFISAMHIGAKMVCTNIQEQLDTTYPELHIQICE